MAKTEEFLKPKVTFGDTLRISPLAFAKMIFWRDCGDTEVAAYATTHTDDPLFITDFRLIKQECTNITFDIDKNDLAEDVEHTLDDGLCPWMTHNILCHTHPGCSPLPSHNDEENFKKAFSHPNWAIMLIIAENGETYCRLKINTAPGVEKLLKVSVDFSQEFEASNHQSWDTEYKSKVTEKKFRMTGKEGVAANNALPFQGTEGFPCWDYEKEDWVEFDRQGEGGNEEAYDIASDCFWDRDGNAVYWCEDHYGWYFFDPVNDKWSFDDADDDENSIVEIERPDEKWAEQVVAWAEKFADEQNICVGEQ
ncbi:hypothetical protein LCGC14_0220740 [marine sediment metagenome]|uniref:JAB domain-containing protein n=1 Tax=marine sediment metagenome TaxID=412755 RepID=A0A0F9WXP2_9ZZZZ